MKIMMQWLALRYVRTCRPLRFYAYMMTFCVCARRPPLDGFFFFFHSCLYLTQFNLTYRTHWILTFDGYHSGQPGVSHYALDYTFSFITHYSWAIQFGHARIGKNHTARRNRAIYAREWALLSPSPFRSMFNVFLSANQ